MNGLPNRLGLMGMFGRAQSVRFGGLSSAASDVYEQGVVPSEELEYAKNYGKTPVREVSFEPTTVTIRQEPKQIVRVVDSTPERAEPEGQGFFDKLLNMVGAGGKTGPSADQQYLAQRVGGGPPWGLLIGGFFLVGLVAVAAVSKGKGKR